MLEVPLNLVNDFVPSSRFPRVISKYLGDSGMRGRKTSWINPTIPGTARIIDHRDSHPSNPLSPNIIEKSNPKVFAKMHITPDDPRIYIGDISDTYNGTITVCTPLPNPEQSLDTNSISKLDSGLHKTPRIAPVMDINWKYISPFLLPKLSAIQLEAKAPMIPPMSNNEVAILNSVFAKESDNSTQFRR